MKIDVGCGTMLQPGWTGLDPVHGEGAYRQLAQQTPWPVMAQTVEAVRASHVMEHVPSGPDRIAVMNEAHRVLIDGGTFEIIVPLLVTPRLNVTQLAVAYTEPTPMQWQAIADPTHVSYWVPESFQYFEPGPFRPNADYGIALWERVSFEIVNGWEAHWVGTPSR